MRGRLACKAGKFVGTGLILASVALAAGLATGAGVLLGQAQKTMPPSPASETASYDDAGFPEVDWEWWQAENPDVVAWITIPGTTIDQPVCQARKDDPERYLGHDAEGEPNWLGALFIDPECEGGLRSAQNLCIGGHNPGFGNGWMFAEVENYANAEWAADHRTVLLQGPGEKHVYQVGFACIVDGTQKLKRVGFYGLRDLRSYVEELEGMSVAKLGEMGAGSHYDHILTLYTCSYLITPANERTLVVCWETAASATQ